ncbi:putative splicing factor, arginine/serine-rich 6 [Oculina patagonica]
MSRGGGPYHKVYVGGLGENGTKEEIEREFEKFGRLHDVWVARNPPGFAFVEFEDLRDAEDAIKELDGKTICGVEVRVEMSKHRGGRGRGGGGGGGGFRGDRYGGGRRDDRYDRYNGRSRSPYRSPPRRRGSPERDRWQSRGGRSRSRSPRRY